MPYTSEAQRAWAHTPEGEKALGGADKVAEWDKASEGLVLPHRSPNSKKNLLTKRYDKPHTT